MSAKEKVDDFEADELPLEPNFKLDQLLNQKKFPIAGALIGLIFLGIGAFLLKQGYFESSDKVEIINASSSAQVASKEIVVDISGAVVKPGVYKLSDGARMQDLMIIAGGLAENADRVWVDKYINLAAKLTDAQKIFIPAVGDTPLQSREESAKSSRGTSEGSEVVAGASMGLVNINTASLSELDTLPGIGPVYGQNIIEHRPYSSVEELLSKGALKKSVYEKIKDKVTIY